MLNYPTHTMLVRSVCTYAATIVSVCSALVLEFDGSFRPSPRDPIIRGGFHSQTAQAFSSSTAAASAALFRRSDVLHKYKFHQSDVDDDGNISADERLFAIGAKSLSNNIQTSADAEYEGLLMGLEQLETEMSSQDVLGEQELIIRGDCKAVIDQMNSRSNPRKTEKYYEEAMQKIQLIRDCSSITGITFEHVPRDSNTLCDALCSLVLNINQKRIVTSVRDLIYLGEEESLSKQNDVSVNNNMRKRNIKKKLRPKSNHYKVAKEEIMSSSRICQSSRLALACLLSKSAIRTKDVAILLQMSDFFLQFSRMFTKIYWVDTSGSLNDATKETPRAVGILCELLAMLFVGAEQEAQLLRAKHKVTAREVEDLTEKLNEQLDLMLELCTTNKKQDDVLSPYSELFISELIDGLNYQRQLLEWNRLANDSELQSGFWLKINSSS